MSLKWFYSEIAVPYQVLSTVIFHRRSLNFFSWWLTSSPPSLWWSWTCLFTTEWFPYNSYNFPNVACVEYNQYVVNFISLHSMLSYRARSAYYTSLWVWLLVTIWTQFLLEHDSESIETWVGPNLNRYIEIMWAHNYPSFNRIRIYIYIGKQYNPHLH